tara:strand:- start:2884 stop:3210 length:327 start_codon:yes stop_codon:yes gene_type:complete
MPKKKEDISIDPKNKGKFTKWVKKNMPGKSTCAGASAVMKNKKKYKPDVIKMANYAKNFGCSTKGKGKGPTATDLSGDGKYTKKDFLMKIGVLDKEGNKVKKDKKTKK